jgi:hypothetical protein
LADVPVTELKAQAMEDALRAYESEWDEALRDMINAQARAFTRPDDTPSVLRIVSAMVDRMDAIDARAIESVMIYVNDPSSHWLRGVLVRRNPHAKEIIDAWLGLKRLITTNSETVIRSRLEDSEKSLGALFQEIRVAAREGWRANIVFGATPSHPDRARYWPEMRRIAAHSQQQALALIADIDRFAGARVGNSEPSISRTVREAVESVTGKLLDTEIAAKPIARNWPPRLGEAPTLPMLDQ